MEILGVRQWEGERSRAQNLKNNNLVKWKYQLKPPGVRQCKGPKVLSINLKNNNLARQKYQLKLPDNRQRKGLKVLSTKLKKINLNICSLARWLELPEDRAEGPKHQI